MSLDIFFLLLQYFNVLLSLSHTILEFYCVCASFNSSFILVRNSDFLHCFVTMTVGPTLCHMSGAPCTCTRTAQIPFQNRQVGLVCNLWAVSVRLSGKVMLKWAAYWQQQNHEAILFSLPHILTGQEAFF